MTTGTMASNLSKSVFVGLVLILLACLAIASWLGCWIWGAPPSIQATVEAEQALTQTYARDAIEVVEKYETTWGSLLAHQHPDVQAQLAIAEYLEHFGYARLGASLKDEPYWIITQSASVNNVRVVERNSQVFRLIACVTIVRQRVAINGELLDILPPRSFRGFYAFARVEENWKLVGFVDTTDPGKALNDWDYAPDWLKNAMGDLPRYFEQDCKLTH